MLEGEWKRADILVYSETDRTLQTSVGITEGCDSAVFALWPGEYTVAVICNSPWELETAALGIYDSLEALSYSLEDEDPQNRLASATGLVTAGGRALLKPRLLSCEVVLEDVNNNMSGYARLEDPRVWLEDVNDEAQILRETGFRQKETGRRTEAVPLPCDVGMFTQYPGTRILCFPNDAAEGTATIPRTTFVLECEIGGETVQMRGKLPSMGRGGGARVSVSVDSATEYEVKCR